MAISRDNVVVALGASTGGTRAMSVVLSALPEDFPCILVVQHMPPHFTRMHADSLEQACAMTVREARNGDLVERGIVLIAPGDDHMRLIRTTTGLLAVSCVPGPKVSGHCPSVDELFFSVAKTDGIKAIGVILTGMGNDGARGLCEMRRRGAFTIGQNEQTCVVYGMPKEAYEMGGVCRQAPLGEIADLLIRHVGAEFLNR